jgi:hypothetical protein
MEKEKKYENKMVLIYILVIIVAIVIFGFIFGWFSFGGKNSIQEDNNYKMCVNNCIVRGYEVSCLFFIEPLHDKYRDEYLSYDEIDTCLDELKSCIDNCE